MNALATGAAGFIGADVGRELLARRQVVDALVRLGSSLARLCGIDDQIAVDVRCGLVCQKA